MATVVTTRLLDIKELSERIGITVATLYAWRSNGHDMPRALKIGGRVRWTEESVAEWIEAQQEAA